MHEMEFDSASPLGRALASIESCIAHDPSSARFAEPVLRIVTELTGAVAGELWVSTPRSGIERIGLFVPETASTGLTVAFRGIRDRLDSVPAQGLLRTVYDRGKSARAIGPDLCIKPEYRAVADRSEVGAVQAYALRAGMKTFGALLLYLDARQRIEADVHRALAQLGHELGAMQLSEQAQSAQLERDARYRAVLSSANDAIVTIDIHGLIVEINDAAVRMFGRERDEVIGALAADMLMPERFRKQHLEGLERYLRTGESNIVGHRNEMIAMRADGSEIPCELNVVRTRVGNETHFTGFLRDLTPARRHEAQQRRFQVISRWSNEAHILLTRDSHIDFVNETAQRWIGAGVRSLSGNTSLEVLPELGEHRMESLIASLQKGPVEPFETLLRSADGADRPVEASATRVDFGGEEYVFLSLRDVSERTKARRQLLERNTLLAEQDRRKDEFIALLAHELRNPLAPIASAAEALLTQELPADQQRLVEMVGRQASVLKRMVADLLEAARVANGKVRIEHRVLDLRAPAQEAFDIALELAAARGHELHFEPPAEAVWVRGDPVRLGQVITNLLDNAIKYTPDGGRVELSLRADAAPDEALVSVRDTGRGIAPEERDAIFEAFRRENAHHTLRESGLGLGLHLVRRLVEEFGGRVSVESQGRGLGSEFRVSLPLAPAPEEVAPSEAPPEERPVVSSGSGLNVLVVDDHVDAAESLAILLRRRGHRVEIASDGNSGLQAARDLRPDIVLLDIGLPGMDGHQVARHLREEQPHLTVLGVTGYDSASDPHDDAFDHRLVKPISYADLEPHLARVQAAREANA